MSKFDIGKSSIPVNNLSNQKSQKKRSEPTVKSTTKNKAGDTYYKITTANALLIAEGNRLIKEMTEEEKANLGSKSDTLHFICQLGLASKKRSRKVNGENTDSFTPVGVRLVSDIDIVVPYLKDVTKNNKTGIDPDEDFDYRMVSAGEEFTLTLYEFMYLITRDEYNGRLSAHKDGKDFYAYLSVKANAYGEVYKLMDNEGDKKDSKTQPFKRKDAKLPTPTIIFERNNGSSRENMVDIDVRTEDGEWVIRKEYKRFEPLLSKRKGNKRKGVADNNTQSPSFNDSKHLNLPKHIIWSLALQEELGLSGSLPLHKAQNEEELLNRGKELFLSMEDTRRELIGCKSSILNVINILAIVSFVGGREKIENIGFSLLSDIAIQVPIIDMHLNYETGINAIVDISYRTVTAGEELSVSTYEWMYLLIQDEYAGSCVCDDKKKEFILSLKFEKYMKGEIKLPMVSFNSNINKIPMTTIYINNIDKDGLITIKPQYTRFAPLIKKN